MAETQHPDPRYFRCDCCGLEKRVKAESDATTSHEMAVMLGPTGEPEYVETCRDCRRLQGTAARRRRETDRGGRWAERATNEEFRELCLLRDAHRKKGADLETAIRLATNAQVAAEDVDPGFTDYLRGRDRRLEEKPISEPGSDNEEVA